MLGPCRTRPDRCCGARGRDGGCGARGARVAPVAGEVGEVLGGAGLGRGPRDRLQVRVEEVHPPLGLHPPHEQQLRAQQRAEGEGHDGARVGAVLEPRDAAPGPPHEDAQHSGQTAAPVLRCWSNVIFKWRRQPHDHEHGDHGDGLLGQCLLRALHLHRAALPAPPPIQGGSRRRRRRRPGLQHEVERKIHGLEPFVVTTFPTVKLGDSGQHPPLV